MTARHWTAVLVWGILLGASGVFVVSEVRVESDLSLLLPQGGSQSQELLLDQIQAGPTSRLILIGVEGGNTSALSEISKKLAAWMQNSGAFVYVANGEGAWSQGGRDMLFQYRYLLSPTVNKARFQKEQLRVALENRVHDLTSPLSLLVKESVSADPTGEFSSVLQAWLPEDAARKYNGVWVSADGRRVLLLAETRAPGFDLNEQEQVQDRLRKAFTRMLSSIEGASNGRLLLSGPAVFSVEARKTIKQESLELSVIAIFLVGLFLYTAYGSAQMVALTIVPLASAIIVSAAVVGLLFGFIHGITLAFGITLIGIAVDYPLHLFSHLSHGVSTETVLERIWPTIRLGVLTTLIGFSAMLLTGFPGLSQLGCFAVIGLLVAACVTRWVLPVFISARFHPARAMPSLNLCMDRMRILWWLPMIGALMATGYLLSSRDSLWEHDLANLSPISSEKKVLDRDLRRELAAPDVRELIVISAETEQMVLQNSEALRLGLDRLVYQGTLSGYEMAAKRLPSLKTQRKRQAALPDSRMLRRDLNEALSGLPFTQHAFEPFLAAVAAAQRQIPLIRADLTGTGLELTLKSLLVERDGQWVALVLLRDVGDRESVIRMVQERDDVHVTYVDMKDESNRLVTTYRDEALSLVGWGMLAIGTVLFLGLRSIHLTVRVLLPVVGSVVVVLALLHGFGEKISLFHLTALLLVAGMGLDYALFFNRTTLSVSERGRTIVSVLVCSLTSTLVFGILAFSEIPVLRAIGMTAAMGSVTCFLFSVFLSRKPVSVSGVI